MSNYVEETAKEADVLNNKPLTVTLTTGVEVTILKCKVKQIGDVLRFLSFLMGALGMKNLASKPAVDLEDPTAIMLVIADSAEHVYPVASSLCSLTVEEIEDLEIEDAMSVMMAEWNLNKDFFLQKVIPMLGRKTTQKSPGSRVSPRRKSTRKKKAS